MKTNRIKQKKNQISLLLNVSEEFLVKGGVKKKLIKQNDTRKRKTKLFFV